MKFDRVTGSFELIFDADTGISTETEIFVPQLQYPHGCDVEISGGEARLDLEHQRLVVAIRGGGEVRLALRRRPSKP
jgi:hypothetical protein